MRNNVKNRGFTLIEILIVIALISVIAGMGYFTSIGFYRSYIFRTEENILVAILEQARSRAQNNISETDWGVHFDSDAYTVFQGTSYNANSPTNEPTPKNPNIQISGITDVVFEQLSGDPTPPFAPSFSDGVGTLTMTDGEKTAVITINNEGMIQY